MTPFGGMLVFVSPYAVEHYEDWSRVRSPGRARRRQRYRQNIERKTRPAAYQLNGQLVMHPDLYEQLKERTTP